MSATTTTVKLIIVAIAAIGVMLPGVNAVESSLKDFVTAKKGEVDEICEVDHQKYKIPLIKCRDDRYQKIDENFKPAFEMIAQVKEALMMQEEEVNQANQTNQTN
ncbi:hypothetical protein [Limnohabitans sp.]|jgi:hypothetical protein|uniref:hypothetical protein n=1 Tax=Limnohabitans sp. TaxID=1907725 RepID=UPI0037C1416A